MKLSIVIPIYGVENYIRQCARSFALFFYDAEIEVLFVNDGTKDRSVNILQEVIPPCENVRIIHRENGGLSAARNTGLENARGEYVYFADSDDYVDAYNLANLFHDGYAVNADIIMGDFSKFDEKAQCIAPANVYSLGHIIYDNDSWSFYVNNHRRISSVVWRCIYKRSIIEKNNLRFHEGCVYEDLEWTPIIYNKSHTIYYAPVNFYYYRTRFDSIINSSISWQKVSDALEIGKSLICYGNQNQIIRDVDFFYRAGLFVIFSEIYKISCDDSYDLWSEVSKIATKMTCRYSKYRIATMMLFLLPIKIVKIILKAHFNK